MTQNTTHPAFVRDAELTPYPYIHRIAETIKPIETNGILSKTKSIAPNGYPMGNWIKYFTFIVNRLALHFQKAPIPVGA